MVVDRCHNNVPEGSKRMCTCIIRALVRAGAVQFDYCGVWNVVPTSMRCLIPLSFYVIIIIIPIIIIPMTIIIHKRYKLHACKFDISTCTELPSVGPYT